mmetsp:Transcript_37856/g.55757  ORF Transcript_37856/g.55757 Transcript_37856/m.55757 type:complete len:655 (+) Transcript_37856:107-2071(+)|eukprot:CAMPEP_0195522456 /NCGR_PEP_ID=MMETSP0794_2-20130614/20653_1 /TAXON_ID=515487 /ORGANISM="Stephanopyxis turris, Strain CCMP 815" /LENGTH=654 /DNA_ID=CAMNT_0040652219 /DNA_START=57 /DNA_END=2021 /DNA_ORIENTATION=+
MSSGQSARSARPQRPTSSGTGRPTSSSGNTSMGRSRVSPSATPSPIRESLRVIVQKRLIEDVLQKSSEKWPGWMVLVVDEPATRMISSVMGMYDLMENRVTLVENLSKKRAPFRDQASIYLVAPTDESVDRIIADFTSTKALYADTTFIYFLSKIPDSVVAKIKKCRPLLRRLKALAEINLDFLAKEGRAFHFDMKFCFADMFQRGGGPSIIDGTIVDKLVTVCATANEYPHIRYPAESDMCKRLAMLFHAKMNEFVGRSPTWWYHGGQGHTDRERSTLLLLDRTIDMLSPLMHEFTYQAMVHDLLPIDDDKIKYKPEVGENNGEAEEKEVLLNENDELWVELKGKHIADVIHTLSERIREIVSTSNTAALQKKDTGKNLSMSQMASALKQLPEYREIMAKLSQHMHISHQCMAGFNKQSLLDLTELEQTLATGQTEDGKTAKIPDLVQEVEEALANMSPDQALRLLAIFVTSQNGIRPQEKDRLLANLPPAQMQTLENLEVMGVPIEQAAIPPKKKLGLLFGGQKLIANKQQNDSEYASSRYVCKLKGILESMATDNLSVEDFPSVLPLPAGGGGTAASVRTRSARPTSRWADSKKKTTFTGGRQIIFMAGGMCYSELRAAQELMISGDKEIILGSTGFLNPSEFIKELSTLS